MFQPRMLYGVIVLYHQPANAGVGPTKLFLENQLTSASSSSLLELGETNPNTN